jgi:hypothetical protein
MTNNTPTPKAASYEMREARRELDEDATDDPQAYEDYLEMYPHDEHVGLDLPGGYGS